jgi:drug/metabolite transporter (DMT)-like permease
VRRAEVALLILLAAAWGALYPLTAFSLRALSPQGVVFARTAIAAVVLVPVAAHRRVLAAVMTHWRDVLVAAGLQATIPLLLLTAGQQRVSASVAGIISGAQPIAVALFALGLSGARRPSARDLTGIMVGVAGVVLLFAGHLTASRTSFLGGAEVLGSAVFFALGAVYIDARLSGVPPLGTAAAAMCVSAVVLAPFAVTATAVPAAPAHAAVAALGVVSGAALVLFYALIRRAGAPRAGIAFYLAPAFAVLYGVTLLGNQLTPAVLAGLGLITAGSLLTLRPRPRRPEGLA